MSTNSKIAKQSDNGSVKVISCHWDGYLTNNGDILLKHYQDEAKIDALLRLGDISFLAPEIGVKHSFDQPPYGTPEHDDYYNMVLAYGRDRGETGVAARTYDGLYQIPKSIYRFDYFYLRIGGKWYYVRPGQDLAQMTELTPEVIAAEAEAEQKREAAFKASLGRR